jgi:hypothetical protein
MPKEAIRMRFVWSRRSFLRRLGSEAAEVAVR